MRNSIARIVCRASWLVLGLAMVMPAAAELRFTTVSGHNDVPLGVVEAGERGNPGILFIHGFAQSHLAFMPQLESNLSQRFHVAAFDLRGQGVSSKPWREEDYVGSAIWADDVAAVIAAIGLERPVLVGWSYGAYVVMDYIRHYGIEAIAGVNLVGSLAGLVSREPPPDPVDLTPLRQQLLESSTRSRSSDARDNLAAAGFSGRFLSTDNMTDEQRQVAFAMQVMMPAYVRRLMRGRKLDNLDIADKVTLPVLLSRGSEDIVMPEAGTRALFDSLRDARVSLYADTGHLPFYAHPQRFNAELARFVRETKSR